VAKACQGLGDTWEQWQRGTTKNERERARVMEQKGVDEVMTVKAADIYKTKIH